MLSVNLWESEQDLQDLVLVSEFWRFFFFCLNKVGFPLVTDDVTLIINKQDYPKQLCL